LLKAQDHVQALEFYWRGQDYGLSIGLLDSECKNRQFFPSRRLPQQSISNAFCYSSYDIFLKAKQTPDTCHGRASNSIPICHPNPETETQLVANKLSSSLRYSPQSACLKQVIPVGSNLLASCVLLAVTPNPNGVSFMLYTTTP